MSKNLNIGLTDGDLKRIIGSIGKYPEITQAILFGSRAKGTFSAGSDIDIALIGKNIRLNDILDLAGELEELPLPYKFDLVAFDRISEQALKDHIHRVGITLL